MFHLSGVIKRFFRNNVKCIECGEYYTPTLNIDMTCSTEGSQKKDMINVCGEACFSRYMYKKKNKETPENS